MKLPPCPVCGRQPKLVIWNLSEGEVYGLRCFQNASEWRHEVCVFAKDEFVAAKKWRRLVGKQRKGGRKP
jgi:hypothetical protein